MLISATAVFSQNYTVTADSITYSGSAFESTFYNKIKINNNTSSLIIMRWVRVQQDMPGNWTSSVCDNVTCHPETTDSALFSLPPNSNNSIFLHFYPANTPGIGTVKIRVYNTTNPSESALLTFIGDATSAGITEKGKMTMDIFPNPAKDKLIINVANNQKALNVGIFNALGQEVKSVNFMDVQKNITVNISELPDGYYFVRIKDTTGNSIVRKLLKN